MIIMFWNYCVVHIQFTVFDKGSKLTVLEDMVQITSEIQVEKENYRNEILAHLFVDFPELVLFFSIFLRKKEPFKKQHPALAKQQKHNNIYTIDV